MAVFSVTLSINGDDSNKIVNNSIPIVMFVVLEKVESVAVTDIT